MRPVDLFSIASSGVNASNQLLQTTSNNIANVNTDGYVRERTEFSNTLLAGVGQSTTERVVDVFAQNQLRRDITAVGEMQAYSQKSGIIDNLLASEANSIANGLSQFFGSVQTAADDPTNLASRAAVLGEAEGLVRRMSTVSQYMESIEEDLNLEFTSQIKEANSLIQNIGELNRTILLNRGNPQGAPNGLLNERDKAINQLAELVSVEVRTNDNGSKAVNLSTGESLVLENGGFNLFELSGGPDTDTKQLQLAFNVANDKPQASVRITEEQLGGALGGLFRFRDEVLGSAQRDIGQMAVAMADAMNTQNKLGMDLDMQLGGNIFSLPEFTALPYPSDAATPPAVDARFTAGKGTEVTDADYKIEIETVDAAGNPTSIAVTALNGDGSPKNTDINGNPVKQTGISVTAGGFTQLPGGVEVQFDSSGGYDSANEFLLQPTKTVASDLSLATSRPEDLAFAAPVRVKPGNNNLGEASAARVTVTNTRVAESAFDGSQGLATPAGAPGAAPVKVQFTAQNTFDVLDSAGNTLTSVTVTDGDYAGLLSQAGYGSDYPGYDFSLSGRPAPGDSFELVYNTNGIDDNTNAIKMAELQQADLVQLSNQSTNPKRSLHDSFSTLVGRVGENSASADVSLQAAEAMKEQSENWFDSVSGVSLDEEAANLVRFQQSYAAAARILSTAQELFNTILSAAR